jgi:thiamine kinase-like enzyme
VKISSPVKADLAGTTVMITNVTDSTIVSSWTGSSGSNQVSTMRVIGDSLQKITVVQWQFVQKLKWYPWEKLGSMMNDKILGTMMEKDLNSLKQLLEKK